LACSPRYVTSELWQAFLILSLSQSGAGKLTASQILIRTIRKEIASCSERAYPSIPISDAKSLLFLESEGSVVDFAKECDWIVKDGRIYFPQQEDDYQSKDILVTSDQVIENTLGYARELEMIV
jgi:hypothetical protein